jgi:Ser/Thr protein kinase RdoA (MazF antagonist)
MAGEESLGGNLNAAVRVGDSVRRRAGPWTPAVHALLRHLEDAAVEAPRALGMDDQGREILTFIPGETHSGTLEPLPDRAFAEEHLIGAARLLRRYHDVVADFEAPRDARWRLTAPTPHDLICHNDWTPWNTLFRKGRVALMLDWDLAGPGSRLWDVVNAAYCWIPLFSRDNLFDLTQRARRLALFCDAYGVDDRAAVIPTMLTRIRFIAKFVEGQARAGDPGFRTLVRMDVPARMADDAALLEKHRTTFERAL